MPYKCIICNLKYASFNYKDEQKPLYCVSCKLDDIIDVIHKRCITCNLKHPNFSYPNQQKALYCKYC